MGVDGKFHVIAQAMLPSRGVSRGTVEDLAEATSSVSKVLEKLRSKVDRRFDALYVNICGANIQGERSKGMVPLSLRGREVTSTDIEKCINVASTISLPMDREIIHKIVHNYFVDAQSPIKNPLGLSASRLEAEVYLITAQVSQIENIYKCVNNAGYDISELVFSGIADGVSILEPAELEEGAILVDVGASLSVITVFYQGTLYDMGVVPVGAHDLRGDLKESKEVNDILLVITLKANELLKRGGKITSITLTGGAAFTDLFAELLEERLMYPIRIGVAKDIMGDISSIEGIKTVTSIGLAKYGYEQLKKRDAKTKNIFAWAMAKVTDILNNYF